MFFSPQLSNLVHIWICHVQKCLSDLTTIVHVICAQAQMILERHYDMFRSGLSFNMSI